jgi:nucleotide-binding universal stress UspA family protein
MLKVLLAIDGSENALRATAYLIKRASAIKDQYQIELVNVQYPLHGTVATFINGAQLKQYHHDEGTKIMAPAQALLNDAGISYTQHLFVGDPAEVISRFAREQACDEIIIGSRGLGSIGSLLVGSVASKIIHLATVPVVLVK